jgi:lipopolysaccharide cholinephosphotransferase
VSLFKSLKQRVLPASSRSFHAAEASNAAEHVHLSNQLDQVERRLEDLSTNLTELHNQLAQVREYSAQEHSYEQNREMILFWSFYQQEGETEQDAKLRFFHSLPPAKGVHKLFQDAEAKLLLQFNEFCKEHSLIYWINGGTVLGAYRHQGFIPWDDDVDVYMPIDQINKLTQLVQGDSRFRVTVIWDWYVACKQIRFRLADDTNPCFIDLFVVDWVASDPLEALPISIEYRQKFIRLIRKKYAQTAWADAKYIDESHPLVPQLEQELASIRAEVSEQIHIAPCEDEALGFIRGIENISENTPSGPYPIDEWIPAPLMKFEDLELPGPRKIEQYLRRTYGDYFALPKDMDSHEHVADNYIGSKEAITSMKKYLSISGGSQED